MIEIDWSFTVRAEYKQDSPHWRNLDTAAWAESTERSVLEPNLLSSEIVKSRKNTIYLKCPAHTDYLKNTFVFKSPVDIDFDIDIDHEIVKVWCANLPQDIFQNIIDLRFLDKNNSGDNQYPIIGIDLLNIFYCRTDMLMSVTPAFLHYNDFNQNVCVIPGQYDISKWVRPVEIVFELKQSKTKFKIQKGDALCYFKFDTDEVVKIKKVPCPLESMELCSKIVAADKFKSLKNRYESFKKLNNE